MNRSQQKRAKASQPQPKPHYTRPTKATTTRRITTKTRRPTTRTTTTPPLSPLLSLSPPPHLTTPQLNTRHTAPTTIHSTQTRNMWFMPKKASLKSRLQKTIVNIFNLAPPPPSVNLEEFALMSKMFQVIIDTRSEELRGEGKIPKSVHVPLSTMTEDNRENIGIQFAKLTVLVYDQNGSTVDEAASYLRDCGAEAWALEGGADAFKSFVEQTRDGTYTRRITLEEAQQHVHAQAMAGGRISRKYDPNRVVEQFNPMLDDDSDDDQYQQQHQQQQQHQHTVAINPSQYHREQQMLSDNEKSGGEELTTKNQGEQSQQQSQQSQQKQNPFAKKTTTASSSPQQQQVQETKQQQVDV